MSILPRTVPPKKLAQSISSVQLTMKLNNILDWDGVTDLAAGDFGTQLFAVLSNSTKTQVEIVEIDPATIAATSITLLNRGLSYDGSQTVVAGNALAWPANDTTVQLGSDVPQLLDEMVDKSRAQTITGVKTFANFPTKAGALTPTAAGHFATKDYVDQTATGNAVTDQILTAGVAGEALALGEVAFFDETDQKWWLADADVSTSVTDVKLGVVQNAAIANDPVNILTAGTDKNQTGLTPGAKYYVSNTPGAISATPGTNERFVGWAKDATELIWSFEADLYRPSSEEKEALAGTSGTPSTSNRYVTDADTTGTGAVVRSSLLPSFAFGGDGADGALAINTTNGTGLITASGTAVTGSGTLFLTELAIGDIITVAGQERTVNGITNNTLLSVSVAYSPAIAVGTSFTFDKNIKIDLTGKRLFIKRYTSISITGRGTLSFINPHTRGTAIVFKSQGNVDITSTFSPAIDLRLLGGTGGVASTSAGGTGGSGQTPDMYFQADCGGNGGIGGSQGGAPGSAVIRGVSMYRAFELAYLQNGVVIAPGAGGGAGANHSNQVSVGGAGGRGGGAMLIECGGTYTCSGTINASGGAGAAGLNPSNQAGGGGGGGAAGEIFVLYKTLGSDSGTYLVTAGANGGGSFGNTPTAGAGGGGGSNPTGQGSAGGGNTASGTVGGSGGTGAAGFSNRRQYVP